MTSQFSNMTSSWKFFDLVLFFLSSLVTDLSFMSILLVLELWRFFFIRVWPEIWISEIPPSEFCPISGDWDKLGIPNLARIFSNEILLNAPKCQGYSFYHFWIIKGKPTGGGVKLPSTTQIRVNPFHTIDIFLYPLKQSKKFWFSDVFRRYRKRSVAWNSLMQCQRC